jgi:hypothetical protein
MNINEEMHRLVLRKRWINWYLRNWKPGKNKKWKRLSKRLSRWKPTYQERTICEEPEMDY